MSRLLSFLSDILAGPVALGAFVTNRVIGYAAAGTVAGVLIVGGVYVTQNPPSGPPQAGTAHMWIQSGGGTCSRSATPRDLAASASSPDSICGTPQQAASICNSGDTVLVMGAAYGAQTISGATNSRSDYCTIQTHTGQTVSFTTLDHQGTNWLKFVGPATVTFQYTGDGTANTFIDDYDFNFQTADRDSSQPFHVDGLTGPFTIKNGVICCIQDANGMIIFTSGGAGSSSNTADGPYLWENMDIHTVLDTTSGVIHSECMWTANIDNVTFRNTQWWNCAVMDVFLTGCFFECDANEQDDANNATNWLLENSIFQKPSGPNENAVAFRTGSGAPDDPSPKANGFTIRNTVIDSGIQWTSANAGGAIFKSSYVRTGFPCGQANVTYSYNIAAGTGCGGTGSINSTLSAINAGFTSPVNGGATKGDYHLLTGSPMKNVGNPADFPLLDKDGVTRPSGAAPDIGPYEFFEGGGGGDSTPPSAPSSLVASDGVGQATLTWSAATDNVGVVLYNVHRSTSTGFTLSVGNRVGQPTVTNFTDPGLAAGTYFYKVTAQDAAANVGAASNEDSAVVTAGSSDTANLWVSVGGGACAGGRSATLITLAAAASPDRICGTWDTAYDAANAGDIVRMTNGNYGNQDISGTKASDVKFIGESRAGVIITGEVQAGSHFWMENVTVNSGSAHGWTIRPSASDITWKNVVATGEYIGVEVFSGNNFTWDGGSLGSADVTPGLRCGGSPNFDIEPVQVNGGSGHKFQNLEVWPQAGAPFPCQVDGFHEEDFRIHSSNTLIENIYFRDGTNVSMHAGSGKIFLSGSGVQNLVIRNVIFGPGGSGANNALDANVSGCTMTIAYSTFTSDSFSAAGCSVTQIHNIAPGAAGVDQVTGRLQAGSPSINAGEAGGAGDYCIASLGGRDFEGTIRPQGSACDKGADERVLP